MKTLFCEIEIGKTFRIVGGKGVWIKCGENIMFSLSENYIGYLDLECLDIEVERVNIEWHVVS